MKITQLMQPEKEMWNEQQQQYYAESGSECPPITEHPVVVDQQMMLMYPSVDDYHAEYLMQQEVGIYGWRKKILYILLVINIVMVGINFALAFWIVSVLGFSTVNKNYLFICFFFVCFR